MFCLAICDDDTLHMQNTLRCARETPEAADCDIRTFSAPGELMDAVTGGGYRPHIALLDICMPDSSGIELAQRLHEKLPRCQVIFVSSFLDYATSVYDVEHVYFILKSQMAQRLGPALRRAMDALGAVRRRPAAGAGRRIVPGAGVRGAVCRAGAAENPGGHHPGRLHDPADPRPAAGGEPGLHPLPPELLGEPVPGPVPSGTEPLSWKAAAASPSAAPISIPPGRRFSAPWWTARNKHKKSGP